MTLHVTARKEFRNVSVFTFVAIEFCNFYKHVDAGRSEMSTNEA